MFSLLLVHVLLLYLLLLYLLLMSPAVGGALIAPSCSISTVSAVAAAPLPAAAAALAAVAAAPLPAAAIAALAAVAAAVAAVVLGYAYIEFSSELAAQHAVLLSDSTLKDRQIKVRV